LGLSLVLTLADFARRLYLLKRSPLRVFPNTETLRPPAGRSCKRKRVPHMKAWPDFVNRDLLEPESRPISFAAPRFRVARPALHRELGTDDGALMIRYAQGDARAFEILYDRHEGALYRYLLRLSHHPETANDLFQEVWSKVVACRERYEVRAQFKTFLY